MNLKQGPEDIVKTSPSLYLLSPSRTLGVLMAGYVVDGEAIMNPYRFSPREVACAEVYGLVAQTIELRV